MDYLDLEFPPQLCEECASPIDVDFVSTEGLTLVLTCPVHGVQSIYDPIRRSQP